MSLLPPASCCAAVLAACLIAPSAALAEPTAGPLQEQPGVSVERLLAVQQLEALLSLAREYTGALDERQALRTLGQAALLSEQLGDVPGAAAFAAEVQLQLGVTAAQAGLVVLAGEAFARAALLDKARRLLDAEAPPSVVALFSRVAQQVAVAKLGEFEVHAAPKNAVVYLDDVNLGTVPARVRAAAGRHVLRVEAQGHAAYGAFIDVLEGPRRALRLRLSPTPISEAAQQLAAAAKAGDDENLAHRRRWLAQSAQTRPEAAEATPLWKRWYVWGGLAILAATATSIALLAARDDPAPRLEVVVDPGDLGR